MANEDNERKPIDIGREIAELLIAWRPEIDGEDVASAIMHALERYSIQIEGGAEGGLRWCLNELGPKIQERLQAI